MGGGATGQISNWAGGGASVTLGAAQMLYGIRQQKRNKRPVYEIPDEINQNLTQAQQQALQGLPEEQKQQYLSNLQRGSAQALASSQSRRGGIAVVAALNQNHNDAYGNMLAMDSQARSQNQNALYGARQTMADYKDQAFQINKSNPYYEKTAQNTAMIGAGMQNVSQGFQSSNSGGGDAFSKSGQQQGGGGQNNGQQMSSNYWNEKSQNGGMKNYNENTSNGMGDYNYQGQQYGTNV